MVSGCSVFACADPQALKMLIWGLPLCIKSKKLILKLVLTACSRIRIPVISACGSLQTKMVRGKKKNESMGFLT